MGKKLTTVERLKRYMCMEKIGNKYICYNKQAKKPCAYLCKKHLRLKVTLVVKRMGSNPLKYLKRSNNSQLSSNWNNKTRSHWIKLSDKPVAFISPFDYKEAVEKLKTKIIIDKA